MVVMALGHEVVPIKYGAERSTLLICASNVCVSSVLKVMTSVKDYNGMQIRLQVGSKTEI